MSFRRRLTLFFLLIVVLPMVAVGVLVVDVTEESTTGQADARLGAQLESSLAVHERAIQDARPAANAIASDQALGAAIASGSDQRIEAVARDLAAERGVTSLRLTDAGGRMIAAVGQRPFAAFELDLTRAGRPFGTLRVSTTPIARYVAEVERTITADVVVADAEGPIRGTVELEGLELPPPQQAHDVEVEGRQARAAAAELPGTQLRLALIGDREEGGVLASSPSVGAALAAFFLLALFFVLMLTRALQGQVTAMLEAAKRIGGGDFSRKVPVVGRDEMAGLASEFNKMSDRLSAQMDELRRQRVEIERSVRRLGEAFASGLDRHALLAIVVETALDACHAQYGLVALSAPAGTEAEAGEAQDGLQNVAVTAEERALRERVVVAERDGDVHAIAGPLARMGRPEQAIGTMSVARRGEPFGEGELDVFRYLLGQASASVENVALHEQVSEQAVTDELTGLANNRALRDVLDKELARAQRFGQDLSVLMLDIDDFKAINDTYGHLQGDEVLRTVARVLSSESRGVDEPARYGGEEFAVVLPETDTKGAVELGERIRTRLAGEAIPLLEGEGGLQVTASLGAATLPAVAEDVRGLIAAADEALYEAKRAGKNRVHSAQGRAGARRK